MDQLVNDPPTTGTAPRNRRRGIVPFAGATSDRGVVPPAASPARIDRIVDLGSMTLGQHRLRAALLAGAAVVAFAKSLHASMTLYNEFGSWASATPDRRTIDFVFETPQVLGDQYAHLGVHFVGPSDAAYYIPGAFPIDGWGVQMNGPQPPAIEILFDDYQTSFAMHYPGAPGGFYLFDGSTEIWHGLGNGGSGTSFFGGISDVPFNRVVIYNAVGTPKADNIYFGGTVVPAPAALIVLAIGALGGRRRRRT